MTARILPSVLPHALALALLLPAAPARSAAWSPAVVSGGWLESKLASEEIVVLDARPLKEFLGAHLPGARNVAPDNLRSTSGGVPATLGSRIWPFRTTMTIRAQGGRRLRPRMIASAVIG